MRIGNRRTCRLQRRVYCFVVAGYDDEAIHKMLGKEHSMVDIQQMIGTLRSCIEGRDGAPVKKIGPWPVLYVKSNGERVFLVGAGHAIGERSLKAFGFKLPKEGRA